MAKKKRKKKKETFEDKHPFLACIGSLVALPFTAPVFICKAVAEAVKETKKEQSAQLTGFQYEQFVARVLVQRGYRKVQVTRKSGDFGADIIARDKKGYRVCVQCKKYAKSVGVRAVQEVSAAVRYYGCNYGMVVTNSTFTSAAKELAARTNVRLIERCY